MICTRFCVTPICVPPLQPCACVRVIMSCCAPCFTCDAQCSSRYGDTRDTLLSKWLRAAAARRGVQLHRVVGLVPVQRRRGGGRRDGRGALVARALRERHGARRLRARDADGDGQLRDVREQRV